MFLNAPIMGYAVSLHSLSGGHTLCLYSPMEGFAFYQSFLMGSCAYLALAHNGLRCDPQGGLFLRPVLTHSGGDCALSLCLPTGGLCRDISKRLPTVGVCLVPVSFTGSCATTTHPPTSRPIYSPNSVVCYLTHCTPHSCPSPLPSSRWRCVSSRDRSLWGRPYVSTLDESGPNVPDPPPTKALLLEKSD